MLLGGNFFGFVEVFRDLAPRFRAGSLPLHSVGRVISCDAKTGNYLENDRLSELVVGGNSPGFAGPAWVVPVSAKKERIKSGFYGL